MTINDFVIGTNVIHKINGNGVVVAIDFNQGMIKVIFDLDKIIRNVETDLRFLIDHINDRESLIKELTDYIEKLEEKIQELGVNDGQYYRNYCQLKC